MLAGEHEQIHPASYLLWDVTYTMYIEKPCHGGPCTYAPTQQVSLHNSEKMQIECGDARLSVVYDRSCVVCVYMQCTCYG